MKEEEVKRDKSLKPRLQHSCFKSE